MTDATEVISKETVEQYELVRQSGLVNMFDYCGVTYIAEIIGANDLAQVGREDYKTLLVNFSTLIAHYGITQD